MSRALSGLKRILESGMCAQRVTHIEGRRLVLADGTDRVDFATGAYLALDGDLQDQDVALARTWGLRNGWSRATGTTTLSERLERTLAERLGMGAVRLSTSAALLNHSAPHALQRFFANALFDAECHVTLKQGLLAAYAPGRRFAFRHQDLADLEARLNRLEGPTLVAVDGVYSMRGTTAPLRELIAVCRRHGAVLFVDDVHGFGVVGDRGLGSLDGLDGEERDHVLLLGSFAKSASNPVAFLAYPKRIWAAAESTPALNYSGPPSNLHVAVCLRHLEQWDDLAVRRERIRRSSERLHRFCAAVGLSTFSPAGSPLLVVRVEDAFVDRAARALVETGILCKVAVHPVVRPGDEALRFCVTAGHTDADLDQLEDALLALTAFSAREAA